MPIRVAIGRQGAREACPIGFCRGSPDDFTCLGCHPSGAELFRRVPCERPDVLVLDLAMFDDKAGPENKGVCECIRLLRLVVPGLPIVVVSEHAEPDRVWKLLASGAQGYLVEPLLSDSLREALRKAVNGEPVLSAAAMAGLVDALREPRHGPCPGASLSTRERQVLALAALEYRNKEIGPALGIGCGTVHTHFHRAFSKLGVPNKKAALNRFAGSHPSSSLHRLRPADPAEEIPVPLTSLRDLRRRFRTEAACRKYLFALRWPAGFECPNCRGDRAWPTGRGVWLCARCRAQISLTAGTIFQGTRLALMLWFQVAWELVEQGEPKGAGAGAQSLNLGSSKGSWACARKLRRCLEWVTSGSQPHSLLGRGERFEKLLQTAVRTPPGT